MSKTTNVLMKPSNLLFVAGVICFLIAGVTYNLSVGPGLGPGEVSMRNATWLTNGQKMYLYMLAQQTNPGLTYDDFLDSYPAPPINPALIPEYHGQAVTPIQVPAQPSPTPTASPSQLPNQSPTPTSSPATTTYTPSPVQPNHDVSVTFMLLGFGSVAVGVVVRRKEK
jgi:hypothetical protein